MPSLADLRERHRGPVITPDDGGFDVARATFNRMVDRRPALVVRPLDVADVVTAVRYASEADLPIAVRGGGHGVAGHCVGDGSVVVDLRLMRYVEVDPEARMATCGGGALWEDLDPACQRHGLATPGGTFGDTGVAGLTLGGGIGHLSPSYGLTLDNLIAAKVITADGSAVSASEDENPDLFWRYAAAAATSASSWSSRSSSIASGSCSAGCWTIASRMHRRCCRCGGT